MTFFQKWASLSSIGCFLRSLSPDISPFGERLAPFIDTPIYRLEGSPQEAMKGRFLCHGGRWKLQRGLPGANEDKCLNAYEIRDTSFLVEDIKPVLHAVLSLFFGDHGEDFNLRHD